jgi:tetratricopeptide (TPR) repeat protein
MIKSVLFVFVLLLFGGCSKMTPQVSVGKKAFAGEDTYIMYALEAEHEHNFDTASSLFKTIYTKSSKKIYLYRSIEDLLKAHMFQKALDGTNVYIKKYPNDAVLRRYKILSLVKLTRFDEAKQEALALVQKTQDEDDFILVSDIYIQQKRYTTALKYLESAYNVNHSTKILDRISTILFVNLQRPKDAIAYLETYVHINGCVNNICKRLAGFYSNQNNIDGMLSTYLRMYNMAPTQSLEEHIVKIYEYQQDYPQLMLFLQRCGCNNELLLRLYIDARLYDKAAVVAKTLYDKTYDPSYLAQSAMYRYESLKSKATKKQLKSIIKELKSAVSLEPKPLYLNYLGYLMIEHGIDIKQGMDYVRQALKHEPDSAYYIDSLALGYYKLHHCKEAYRLIKRVVRDVGLSNPEVRKHYNMIKKCQGKKK